MTSPSCRWLAFVVMLLLFTRFAVAQEPKDEPGEATLRLLHNIAEKANKERIQRGLPPLKLQPALNRAAVAHARDMARFGYFAHATPQAKNGEEDYETYARAEKYTGLIGENLYHGEPRAAQIITLFMNSPTHRENILDTGYVETGIGLARGKDFYDSYCVQFFGMRNDYFPVIINNEAYSTTNPTVHLYIYGRERIKQMRFSSDGVTFSVWEPFKSEKNWNVASGEGVKTVFVELSDGEQTFKDSDSIRLLPEPKPTIP